MMTSRQLEIGWARSQLEAMADGSLRGRDLERMRRVLAQDPQLREDLARASAMLAALRARRPARPPRGLLGKLLFPARVAERSAPTHGSRPLRGAWRVAIAGVCATALVAILVSAVVDRGPAPEEEAAVRDFVIAMSYLQRTAETAQRHVGEKVGGGLAAAIEISRESVTARTDGERDERDGG